MMLMVQRPTHRQLRTPRRHGEAIVDPPLDQAGDLLEQNAARAEHQAYDFQGRSHRDLSRDARRGLLDEAYRYTTAYRDVGDCALRSINAACDDLSLILSGHQPQLFHPGVWFKNFALSQLSRQFGACGVNLLIDNDPLRAPSIRVPTGSLSEPRLENVLLDRPHAEVPFEERSIRDRDVFGSFGHRVARTIEPLVANPLINQLWPLARQAAESTSNMGQCLAQARHMFEQRAGLDTLEVPFSAICGHESFLWFVAHLVAQLPRLWDVHNSSLLEFRREHRIRSRSHPVPELAAEDDWLEAPFWVWSADNPQRRRLLVRSRGETIELTDRDGFRESLELSPDAEAGRAVEQLADLAQRGIKLRPRALITTMYARLVLGDLFLHGIGGAKYDQLTDIVIERFFGLHPPAFVTLTATALLPVQRPDADPRQLKEIDRQLRELNYHPERFVDGDGVAGGELTKLRDEKIRWFQSQPPRGHRRERHEEITRINAVLQPFVEPIRQEIANRRARLSDELRKQRLLGGREFSFCLFPQETLLPLLLELCAAKD